MLDQYSKEITTFIEWYARVKELIITAESLDVENKSYIQPMHEQRYCLDHFVRAIVYERINEEETVIRKALESATAHLQRAYSDAVEWVLISVTEEYRKVLLPFSNIQIKNVFPEYYKEVRNSLDSIKEIVNEYKLHKSVEKEKSLDICDAEMAFLNKISTQFVSMSAVDELITLLKFLHKKEEALIEAKIKDDKDNKKRFWIDKIALPTATAIISGVIVAIITFAITS